MADRRLSLGEAAEKLGITPDSVRNWTRQGLLIETGEGFDSGEVDRLLRRIDSGEVDRLSRRANKSRAAGSFIPREYIDSPASLLIIRDLVKALDSSACPPEAILFWLVFRLFAEAGDLIGLDPNVVSGDSTGVPGEFPVPENFRRPAVYRLLHEWRESLSTAGEELSRPPAFLLEAELPPEEDLPGIVYQSLLREGHKAGRGSYYTPRSIVAALIAGELPTGGRVLDPACGTGQFLLALAQDAANPEDLWGIDLDLTAVRIARANLLLKFPDTDFTPRIYHENSLQTFDRRKESFDLIATNPPWGARIGGGVAAVGRPALIGRDSFSRFLHASWQMLKPGGKLCFILPESLTNVRTHADIRAFLTENVCLSEIELLGKRFRNVMSPVITLKAVKVLPPADHTLTVRMRDGIVDKSHSILQARFRENRNGLFDLRLDETAAGILGKMVGRDHLTLEDRAEWGLGIVTGDNRRFVHDARGGSGESGGSGMSGGSGESGRERLREPVLRGCDIEPYRIKPPVKFLEFQPRLFQQAAPEAIYRTPEKLVYRFIAGYPVFAVDTGGRLTLNSANILIPRLEGYTLPSLLAFLNSCLFRFYFREKFHPVKILRGDLEELPFPLLKPREVTALTSLAEDVMAAAESGRETCMAKIDQWIYRFYRFSEEEVRRIETGAALSSS